MKCQKWLAVNSSKRRDTYEGQAKTKRNYVSKDSKNCLVLGKTSFVTKQRVVSFRDKTRSESCNWLVPPLDNVTDTDEGSYPLPYSVILMHLTGRMRKEIAKTRTH